MLFLRRLSKRRINIGPHSSGKTNLLICQLTKEQVEFLPSAPLYPTPAPPWATGTIRCTQATWRALSFQKRSGSFQNQLVGVYQFEEGKRYPTVFTLESWAEAFLCRVTYGDRARWGQFRLDSLAVDGVSLELNLLLFLSFNRLVNRSHLPHFLTLFPCNDGGWRFWALEICKTSKQANQQIVSHGQLCKKTCACL